MAILDVLAFPDPRLRRRAEPVRAFDAALAGLVGDLFETLYATRAIGLAATQVDVHRQVLVIDVSGSASAPEVFINPQIVARHRYGMVEESCLSLPGLVDSVKRPIALRVRACDASGRERERELDGMLAVCLQHELDHLQGKLFLDHLPLLKRLRARRRLGAALHGGDLALGSSASAYAGRGTCPADGVPQQPFQPAEVPR
jgi:peptide deformylase